MPVGEKSWLDLGYLDIVKGDDSEAPRRHRLKIAGAGVASITDDEDNDVTIITISGGGEGGGGGVPLVDPQYYEPAAAAKALMVSGGRKLGDAYAYNAGATDMTIMFFNAIVLPSNGAEPKDFVVVPAGSTASIVIPNPKPYSAGIYWAASSSPTTLNHDVAAAAAQIHLRATHGSI
jgi:hypothetical protein